MQDVNETAALLKRAGVLDHRRPDEAALLLWHELLAPYTLRDCVDALTAAAVQLARWRTLVPGAPFEALPGFPPSD